MIESLQDEALVKFELAELDRQVSERAPWESQWRDIDERVDPNGDGGFQPLSPGGRRGARNFDVTAIEGLDRFQAAMSHITVPLDRQYIRLRFADKDLDKIPEVRRWCEYAGDRLYAIRYAPQGMFNVSAGEDFRQLGKYGTSVFWTEVRPSRGIFYRTLHMSECYIDTDFSGLVDTCRRKTTKTVRELKQLFSADALTPKMQDALKADKLHQEFEILHSVRPNGERQSEALDWRGMPVMSNYFAIDEKMVLRRGGYRSSPLTGSRHVTSPGDKYGRSPAMKVLPAILGVNQMQQTMLRAGHKATDPALAFFDDDGIDALVTKPGGLNPGMVNSEGQMLVQPMPQGGNLPIGMDLIAGERLVIDTAFLGDYFKMLTDEKIQRSATAVLSIEALKGVLVSPYASRYETEKQNPITLRELEEGLRSGQIDPPPPVVYEAGVWPMIEYLNPMQQMARAQEAAGVTRLVEVLAPLAQADPEVYDVINIEEAAPGVAEALGVRSSWTRTPEEIAALRAARAEAKAAAATVEQLNVAADAYQKIAKGNSLSEAA